MRFSDLLQRRENIFGRVVVVVGIIAIIYAHAVIFTSMQKFFYRSMLSAIGFAAAAENAVQTNPVPDRTFQKKELRRPSGL